MMDDIRRGPKYPGIEVELVGQDGNAFYILGATMRALRQHGVAEAEVEAYHAEATSGDYDRLLRVTMDWVEVL